MKQFLAAVTLISIFSAFLVSCYYDNEEVLYPKNILSCDTSLVTFTATIAPMMANNCLMCHSNVNAPLEKTIPLENYAAVVAAATSIAGSIKHTGVYPFMPKTGDKIRTCYITQFDIWVRKGMPQ